MAFQPIPDAWRASMNGVFNVSGHPWAMVFGVHHSDTHNLAAAIDISAAFVGWWSSNLQHRVTNDISLQNVTIVDQSDETGPAYVNVTGLPDNGDGTGVTMPSQAAVMVTLLTGLRGRANRGRKYVPGVGVDAEAANDPTQILDSTRTAMNTAFANLIDAIDGASGNSSLAVLSFTQLLALPITSVETRLYIGTHRSRSAV